MLGLHAAMGRLYTVDDQKPGNGHVLVLGWEVWQQYFHSDPHILGRAVSLNGESYRVIGVMPKGSSFPENSSAMYSPAEIDPKDLGDRGSSYLIVLGRLRPGVSVKQAQQELDGIHRQLEKEYAEKESLDPVGVEQYQEVVTDGVRPALLALGAAVLAVWLIACANVAGLLLTRAGIRRREIAIRGALGAGRSRLVRQFLTESLLLSVGGGALGLAVAALALRLLARFLGDAVRYGADIHIDPPVCAYLLLASCVSALVFGIVPGLIASRVPAQEGLREGSAGAGTGRRQHLWRDTLVVGEIALTLALLMAGGLMLRTLWSLRHVELGFVPRNLITTTMILPQTHGVAFVNTDAKQTNLITTFYRPLLEKLRATPGFEGAELASLRAMESSFASNMSVQIVGMPKPERGQEPRAMANTISPGYYHLMGTPLLRGRFFDSSDRPGEPYAVLVNRAFVHIILHGKDAIGQRIDMSDDEDPNSRKPPAIIVGVVADSRQQHLGDTIQPEVDFDLEQMAPGDLLYSVGAADFMDLSVRTRLAPVDAIKTMTAEIRSLNSSVFLQHTATLEQIIDDSLSSQTLAVRLLSIFGVAALAIAAAGIYGLLSYAVSQRTRELGIRLALGAQRADVFWLILSRATMLLVVGMVLGFALAWSSSGILRAFLYGLRPVDAVTVLGVGFLLSVCGLAASYFPARRAASTDPMIALRSE
jgi:predicted permease